jgi:DNA-binding MarR family transcriptional regulator
MIRRSQGEVTAQRGEAGQARRDALAELIRGYQRDTDAFDEAVAERMGVNRTDLRCLDVLVERAGQGRQLTPKELAEASQLSPSAITTVLDRLAAAGYIRRVRDEDNRRLVRIALTPALIAAVTELFAPMIGDWAAQLDSFSDDELDTLIRFFTQAHEHRLGRTAAIREATLGATAGRERRQRR